VFCILKVGMSDVRRDAMIMVVCMNEDAVEKKDG
jgi:hypothetical protein